MTITAYVEREVKHNKLSRELVTELKKVSDDIEFIGGVLLDVENNEDKKALLEYIRAGIDVDFYIYNINCLMALSTKRRKHKRKLNNNDFAIGKEGFIYTRLKPIDAIEYWKGIRKNELKQKR